MARKSGKNTPTIISGVLYTNDEQNGIRLSDPEWSMYLEDATSFYYQHENGGFSARKQHHRHGYFWYAYKRINGKLEKRYLGFRENINADLLLHTAEMYACIKAGLTG